MKRPSYNPNVPQQVHSRAGVGTDELSLPALSTRETNSATTVAGAEAGSLQAWKAPAPTDTAGGWICPSVPGALALGSARAVLPGWPVPPLDAQVRIMTFSAHQPT